MLWNRQEVTHPLSTTLHQRDTCASAKRGLERWQYLPHAPATNERHVSKNNGFVTNGQERHVMAWTMGNGLRDCPAASLSFCATGSTPRDAQAQSDFLFLSSASRSSHTAAHEHDRSTLASLPNNQEAASRATILRGNSADGNSHLLLLVASDAGVKMMTPVVTSHSGLPANFRGEAQDQLLKRSPVFPLTPAKACNEWLG